MYNSFYYNKGNVSMCCLQDSLLYKDDWTDVNLADFYFGKEFNNIRHAAEHSLKPPACETCWANERNGTPSMRQQNMYYTPDTYTLLPQIKHVDLRLSNKCNLQCKMCSPSDSDQIAKILGKDYGTADTTALLEQVFALPSLEAVRFAGGEPMIMPEVEQFLHRLVEAKRTNIHIELITNCTTVKPRMLEILNNFDHVDIMASIDGVGKWFEFQRAPARWSIVKRNFHLLYNSRCHVRLVPCIGNINLLGIVDFFQWANQYPNALVTFNEIFTPEYLNFRFVPMELRHNTIKTFKTMRLENAVPGWTNFKERLIYEHVKPTEKQIQQLLDRNALVWGADQTKMREFFPWIYT
jgi:sulfatase maturation enzyme AslB (radical SAM superfamily)